MEERTRKEIEFKYHKVNKTQRIPNSKKKVVPNKETNLY